MKNHPICFALLFILFYSTQGIGQDPFVARLGSNLTLEAAYRIIPTPDSNYLMVGFVADDANIDREALVLKIDAGGTVLWGKTYGGDNWEEFVDVAYVGGFYYCVGYTRTWVNGTYIPQGGGLNLAADVFLVKLKLDGSLVWAKHMGTHITGTDPSKGNEVGLSILSAFQGGVIIVARLNNGSSTDQGNAIIWVTPDAKTQWAYQYNYPHNNTSNELVHGIWKDGAQNFITGGSINTTTDTIGGFLFKIDQNGELLWAQNTRCSPGILESQIFGYYNHGTGKVYTTDYYNESNNSILEIPIMTNWAADGAVPPSGTVPQSVRFHYGSAGSSGNKYRSKLFPVGDGYQQMILAANLQASPDSGTTQQVTLIAAGTDLSFHWSKKIGAPGAANKIFDLVTCDGNNRELLAVGSVNEEVYWGVNQDILVARIIGSGTIGDCELADTINRSTLSAANAPIPLERINLIPPGCDLTCWADNDTIGNVEVNIYGPDSYYTCGGDTSGTGGGGIELQHVGVTECPDTSCITNLSFTFDKTPKQVYFEITDASGDYLYERFWGNVGKLTSGYNFETLGLKPGEYIWELLANYDNEAGIERRIGRFVVE